MTVEKTVLILGASRYYTAAINAARQMGCRIAVADRDPDAPGMKIAHIPLHIDIKDKKGILDAALRHDIDAIVPLNDFGVQTAAYVADHMGLAGISQECARTATAKGGMREAWKSAGVPSVRFKVVNTLEEAEKAAHSISYPLIIKPNDSRGGGSRGVSRVDAPSELQEAVEFAQRQYPDRDDIIVEEFRTGREFSAETITFGGRTQIIAVGEKEKTRGRYRVDKSVNYPAMLSEVEFKQVKETVEAAVEAIGIELGPAHVEFCLTDKGPVLFELGARCGGGGTPDPIVPWVTGYQMFREVIKLYLGHEPSPYITARKEQRGSVYRFLTPKPGQFRRVEGMEEISRWPGILDHGVTLRSGDPILPVKTGLHRAGFIITGMPTPQEAMELADRAEMALRFIYMDSPTKQQESVHEKK